MTTTATAVQTGATITLRGTCYERQAGQLVPAPRRIWLLCPVCRCELVAGTYQEVNGEEWGEWICLRHGWQYTVVTRR